MIEKITAVLIESGPEYPNLVLERLTCTDFFDEILILENCPSIYHRYLSAKKATNNLLYFQDSDALVNYQVLWNHYDGRLTNAMPAAFQEKYAEMGCTLVGWGCYFPKSMLSVFDRYIQRYGIDDHLLREADRIFTHLNQPFNTIIMPHEDLFQTPDRMGYDPYHYASALEAIEKARNL